MSFLNDLLKGGPSHLATRNNNGVSLKPSGAGVADLAAFQEIAAAVLRNDGQGYTVFQVHRDSDGKDDFIDLILLQIDEQ